MSKIYDIAEPTTDQCSAHEVITLPDGQQAVAGWYPQMGGYSGRCLIVPDLESPGSVDVYVWHNGDFPFKGYDADEYFPGEPVRSPSRLHHCDPDQFVGFGKFCEHVVDQLVPEESPETVIPKP